MARLFIAVGVSPRVAQDLLLMASGIPGARWQGSDQFHITLQFLGEVHGGQARQLATALQEVDVPAFETALTGCGVFPHRGPTRALWLGVEDPKPFAELHHQVTKIADDLGLRVERRRFTPHLTMARFSRRPPQRLLADWIQNHFTYRSPRFVVRSVHVFSSVLAAGGAKYCIESSVALPRIAKASTPESKTHETGTSAWRGLWPLPPEPEPHTP